MDKGDIIEEFGWVNVPLHNYATHFHIKEITDNYVLLEDACPKDKGLGNGDMLKLNIDLEDSDEIDFRENCKRIVKLSKKHKKCPEVSIELELGSRLNEVIG